MPLDLGLPVSGWDLDIFQNDNQIPYYIDLSSWEKITALEGGLYGSSLPSKTPCETGYQSRWTGVWFRLEINFTEYHTVVCQAATQVGKGLYRTDSLKLN